MNRREEKFQKAKHKVWETSKNEQERIEKLEQLAIEYPEFMTSYSDIATSYLSIGDIENAKKTYQKIIDLKDTFKDIWENKLGKAYLFTNNIEKAIECFEKFAAIGYSYDNGLYLAIAYLKKGDRKTFELQFDKWISDNLRRAFDQYYYLKEVKPLLNDEEAKLLEDKWDKYYDKYSNMEPYQLYLELYKQCYENNQLDEELEDDELKEIFDDDEVPPKLTRFQFERLKAEYLYLDRKTMFDKNATKEDFERFYELRDLLFGDIIF